MILTIIPGDDACMISGLKLATSEIILGLSAKERGTFWYQGQGKLQNTDRHYQKTPTFIVTDHWPKSTMHLLDTVYSNLELIN